MTSDSKKKQDEAGRGRVLTAYETYNKLVETKVSDFEKVKEYLSETLEKLLERKKIGLGVVLMSRIKAPESVVQNWKLGKNLNDIFGITLLTATDAEMKAIKETLRKSEMFNISSKKEKNEKRGYEAMHFLFNVGEETENKTKVECHLQTHDAYKSVYPHIFYKVRTRLNAEERKKEIESGKPPKPDRDLTPEEEEQIVEKIQEMYEEGSLIGEALSNGRSSRVPQMWVTSFNQNGKMEEQYLEEEMILKIMYPFLDLSKKKTEAPNDGKKKNEEVEI